VTKSNSLSNVRVQKAAAAGKGEQDPPQKTQPPAGLRRVRKVNVWGAQRKGWFVTGIFLGLVGYRCWSVNDNSDLSR